jgi:IS66 C-terminal element
VRHLVAVVEADFAVRGQRPVRWAIANTLIQTCKLSSVDPLAWLIDVLQRIIWGRTKSQKLHTLLPWKWRPPSTVTA